MSEPTAAGIERRERYLDLCLQGTKNVDAALDQARAMEAFVAGTLPAPPADKPDRKPGAKRKGKGKTVYAENDNISEPATPEPDPASAAPALTQTEREVMQAVEFIHTTGTAVTAQKAANRVGATEDAVKFQMHSLKKKGYLSKPSRGADWAILRKSDGTQVAAAA